MDWKSRVRTAFQATHLPEDDVLEELAQHARALYDAARADGCSQDEADRHVNDQLDRWRADATALRRTPRRVPMTDPPPAATTSSFVGTAHDVRYALRLLRRQPRYALLATLTMALGIGATTTLFSVTYGVLMKPLPWPEGERLVLLKETRGGNPPRFNSFSNAAYLAWREQASTVEDIAAWSEQRVTLSDGGDPTRVRVVAGTASLFKVLRARPLIGSLFEEDDEKGVNGAVIVLSESLWRQRFGGDRGAIGRVVQLDRQPYTIVGVLPDSLAYPDRQIKAWIPFRVMPATGGLSMFEAVARLEPRATAAQAAAEGTARGRFAADTAMTTIAVFGGNGPVQVTALPLRDALTADVRRPLLVLLVAVGLLLATATANVAGLQLARAVSRSRELAIRAALGAGIIRVTRQLLIESVLLGLAGGAAGLALAWLLHRTIPSVLPPDFPRLNDLAVGSPVVLFAVVVSMLTSLVFGLMPALRVRRLNLLESLSEHGGVSAGPAGSSRTTQTRMLIMAGQVAIACVLLVGAALLGRSFVALVTADRGYEPSGVLAARLSLPSSVYAAERRYAIVDELLGRLANIPSVTHAAFTSELPLTPGGSTSAFTMQTPDRGVISAQASPRVVSAKYFSAIGMRFVAGRGFSEADTETSQRVIVINQAFARQYLGPSPVGAMLPMGVGYQDAEARGVVIGVVEDVRYPKGAAAQPELYFCYRQLQGTLRVPVVTLLLRTPGAPEELAVPLRGVVRAVDDGLVPEAIAPLEERILTTLLRPRLYAMLLSAFAACALLVAAVGLFGVLSYSVSQRSRELAVRSAVGARQLDLVLLVLRQGVGVTAVGVAAGLLMSAALIRSIGALLYGVTAHDPITYAGVALLLLAVAAVACLGPALRAARLDPVRTLRE